MISATTTGDVGRRAGHEQAKMQRVGRAGRTMGHLKVLFSNHAIQAEAARMPGLLGLRLVTQRSLLKNLNDYKKKGSVTVLKAKGKVFSKFSIL